MQHAMTPPEAYGSTSHVTYESYRQEQSPRTDYRRPRTESASTPSTRHRHVGYREDYSRAQHASLEEEQHPITRAKSDVGPSAVSQEYLRFSAHVNRFASHDPRTTPVHSNVDRGVSVSERIKRFNTGDLNGTTTRQPSPSPRQYREASSYPTSPYPKRRHSLQRASDHEVRQEQAPRSTPTSQARPESSYRRDQEMVQDHYHPESRQKRRQKEPTTPYCSRGGTPTAQSSSAQRSLSRERERRSQSPAARPVERSYGTTQSSERNEREQRSRSPAARLTTESNLGSPSRAIETQRAARSLLAKRRQRRLEQEAKDAEAEQKQQSGYEKIQTSGCEAKRTQPSEVSTREVKKVSSRDDSRTDRILREARSRSMSPRISRYSRKAYGTPQPSSTLLKETPETPARAADYRGNTPKRRTHAWDSNGPASPVARTTNHRSAPRIALRDQEYGTSSPKTPASQRGLESLASSQQRGAGKNSGDSINTSGSNTTSSIQELKRQLWDNNETLQVAVKPSLSAHGYSERRTKQTSDYYAPEMAGRHGQRVRSLSPNPRVQVHGHERPASAIEAPSAGSAMFNSKFVQAALSSQREGHSTPPPGETQRTEHYSSSPSYRRREHQLQHRAESPRPSASPGKAEPFRSRSASASPVPSSATHSIERVPSSAGVSTATGEASVAKLVAKLTSVSRDDPERALRMIDTILQQESKSSSGAPGSRAESRSREETRSPIAELPIAESPIDESPNDDVAVEEEEEDDDESESSETSCDDTSVSSITNPTYQRDDKAYSHGHAVSTSSSRNPRPSSLNKYSQLQPSSPQDDVRGKSSRSKKEKKPPPPATINVCKSDSGGSGKKSSSKKEKASDRNSSPTKVRALSPSTRDQRKPLDNEAMDPAAIAMKIKGWDEQVNHQFSDLAPLSPTKTEDTVATEELGSIITPQSQKQTHSSESRRAHPWDDSRPDSGTKPRAIDLTVRTGVSTDPFGKEDVDTFEPMSPWQRRARAAKQEVDESDRHATGVNGADQSRSNTPSSESPRIAPNVYDVHRNRRRRSRSREGHPDKSRSLLDEKAGRRSKPSAVNPFDADYSNPPESARSQPKNPFDGDDEPPTRPKSEAGVRFDSSQSRRPSGTKSDTGSVFEHVWEALPSDTFPRGHHSRAEPVDLPPRTPKSNRASLAVEEAPEASRDPSESGGRRRNFLKMKRSGTPKKERQPLEPSGSKPLLSSYAMDSVEDAVDGEDKFNVRKSALASPGRRSRTLSPVPRKLKRKSKSPGRNRLRMNRNDRKDSFTDGEDESSSLTGSLTGSTASSVRNKNLAKKFSRFLKVYED